MSRYLTVGTTFANRYRIERKIASGGMGEVFEATHLETNRRRALKVLHRTQLDNEAQRARFRKEARLAAAVESEHIVDVFDAGVDEASGMPFLVMELLRGEDLADCIDRVGPLAPAETVQILNQVAAALDKTHRAKIIHRDLKPENVFLCEREHGPPRVKLLDFGVAKFLASETQGSQTTDALGTPLYMAPEQFNLSETPSPATDVYAIGLMAFTMLAGKPYWSQEARSAIVPVAFAVTVSQGPQESAVARALRYSKVSLPEAFDKWFFRASAPSTSDRFPSAVEAITELAKALDVPISADIVAIAGIGAAARVHTPTTALPLPAPVVSKAENAQEHAEKPVESRLPKTGLGWAIFALVMVLMGASAVFLGGLKPQTGTSDSAAPATSTAPSATATASAALAAPSSATPALPSATTPTTATAEPTTEPSAGATHKSFPKQPPTKTKEGDRRKHWSND